MPWPIFEGDTGITTPPELVPISAHVFEPKPVHIGGVTIAGMRRMLGDLVEELDQGGDFVHVVLPDERLFDASMSRTAGRLAEQHRRIESVFVYDASFGTK